MNSKITWDIRKDYSDYPDEVKEYFFKKYIALRKKYTNWIGQISKDHKNDIDWWSSIPSSRNPNFSKLFEYICVLETVELIKKKKITIIVDNKSFYKIIKKHYGKNKNLTLTLFQKRTSNNIFKYFISILFQLFIFILIKIFFRKNLDTKKNIFINNYFNYNPKKIERHFIFSENFYNKYLKKIIFIPTFLPTKNFFKLIQCINISSKKNYFYKENILSFSDLFFAFSYIFRKKKFNKKYLNYKKYDLSDLIYDEIKNLRYYNSSLIGILNNIFVKKILKKKNQIKKTICWMENHEVKGWNMAFRKLDKKIKVVGYQGFTNLPQLMNTIPTKFENKYKVIPNEIIVSGKAYIKTRKEFYKNLKIKLGPALIYQGIFDKKNYLKKNLFLLILTEFNNVNKNILNWLNFVISNNNKVKVIIKKPKLLNSDNLLTTFKNNKNVKIVSDNLSDLLKNSKYVIISGPSGATLEALAYNCKLLIPFIDPYDEKYLKDLRISKNTYQIFKDRKYFSETIYKINNLNLDKVKKNTSLKNYKNYLFQKIKRSNEKIFI